MEPENYNAVDIQMLDHPLSSAVKVKGARATAVPESGTAHPEVMVKGTRRTAVPES